MIRALVFDFDGLILETETPDFQAWREVYQQYSCDLTFETWATGIGSMDMFDPCGYLEEQLGRPVDRKAVRAQRLKRYQALADALEIMPGVAEYIADARRLGLQLAVASSSPCRWVTGHLSRLGLRPHFDCVRCADHVEYTKPDPAVYHAVLDALDLRGEQALALEDSAHGVLAAKGAGMWCVAVPNPATARLCFDHADLRLRSLADMPLEQLLRQVAEQGSCGVFKQSR